MQHKCFRCGTEFDGNFCPECGEKWQQNKTCPKCGAALAGSVKFCNQCGYSFGVPSNFSLNAPPPVQPPQPARPSAPVPPSSAKPQKPPKVAKLTQRDTVPQEKREELMPEMESYYRLAQKRLGFVLLFLFLCGFFLPSFIGNVLLGREGIIRYLSDLDSLFGPLVSFDSHVFEKTELAIQIFGYIFTSLAFICLIAAIVLLVQCKKKKQYGWHPEKVYSNKLYQALYVYLMMRLSGFLLYFGWMLYQYFMKRYYNIYENGALVYLIVLGCVMVPGAITMMVLSIIWDKKLDKKRTELSIKLCGYPHPSLNAELVEQYKTERAASVYQDPEQPLPLIRRDIATAEERQELWPEMAKHIKQKRIVASLFFLLLFASTASGFLFMSNYVSFFTDFFYLYLLHFYILFLVLIGSLSCKVKKWRPDKLYCYKSLKTWIIVFITLYLVGMGATSLSMFLIIITGSPGVVTFDDLFEPIGWTIMFIGGLVDLAVTIPLYVKLAKQRKALCPKLCGYDTPIKNKDLVMAYQKECKEYNKLCRQNRQKRAVNREIEHAWTVYRYQKKRYESGKTFQNITYPRAWLYFHRVALSVTAASLAVVITVTCVLCNLDTRFSVDNIVKIGLPADQQAVTKVLGDPFETKGSTWYYFSKNYMSIEEKLDKLAESDSFEDAFEKSAELEEKLMTLEYQAIIVTFSGSNVMSMLLDAAAVGPSELLSHPHEKQVIECKLSKTLFRVDESTSKAYYTVSYGDGSYCMAYLPEIRLTEAGTQTITWTNVWGNYSATVTVQD